MQGYELTLTVQGNLIDGKSISSESNGRVTQPGVIQGLATQQPPKEPFNLIEASSYLYLHNHQPTFGVLMKEVFKDPAVCKTFVDQFPTPGEMVRVNSLSDD
ncbi:hypothetical protein Tco_1041995 [Tanacetum coccineum]|uniref:Uncharacterized protein n=1 Tax=Tanacetum coccineum TaxID=301880 RepID=A0ABQ5GJ31_9ASTR